MMKQGLLFITLILNAWNFSPAQAAFNDDQNLAKALLLLKQRDYSHAYPVIEALAQKQIRTKNPQAVELSLILAFADVSYLKNSDPSTYAMYALNHLDAQNSNQTELKAKLLRIVADGFYKKGKLEPAKKYYLSSAQTLRAPHSNADTEAEYVAYQLGWVYLSEKSPLQAFHHWKNWLRDHQKGLFVDEMIRDTGRAWTEVFLSGKGTDKIQDFKISDQESFRNSFIQGIVLEYERYRILFDTKKDAFSESASSARFIPQIKDKAWVAQLFHELNLRSRVFEERPCDQVDWILATDFDSGKEKDYRGKINQCIQKLDQAKKLALNDPKLTQLKERIGQAYLKTHPQGSDSIPLAYFLEKTQHKAQACHTYLTLQNEISLQKESTKWLTSAWKGILTNCPGSTSENYPELISRMMGSEILKFSPPENESELTSLIQALHLADFTHSTVLKSVQETSLEGMIRYGTLIPFYSKLIQSNQKDEAQKLLSRIWSIEEIKTPVKETLLRSLMDLQGQDRQALLEKFYPMKSVDSLFAARLWAAKALQDEGSEGLQTLIEKYHALRSNKAWNAKDRKSLAILSFKTENPLLMATWWDETGATIQSNPKMLEAYVSNALTQSKDQREDLAEVFEKKSPPLHVFLKWANSLLDSDQPESEKTPSILKKSRFFRELTFLKKEMLLKDQLNDLVFSPESKNVEKTLMTWMSRVKAQIASYRKMKWTLPQVQEKSKTLIQGMSETLALKVKTIPTQNVEEKQELDLLSESIRKWSQGV